MKIKFLVIRLSSIGDIVLTSPIVRALKQQVEDSEIHFFVKKQFSDVIVNNPYIDKIHLYDGNLKEAIREFKNVGIDYIIDLHKNFRSIRVRNALKIPDFTFNKLNLKKWLAVRLKKKSFLPKVHIVDRYFEAVKHFDVKNDNKGLDYFINEKKDAINLNLKDFIVFVVGAKHNTKKIPIDIATRIINGIEKPVVLLGGQTDVDDAKAIENKLYKKVLNLVGKLKLNESAYVIKMSDGVITPDTGLMHIASAFKKNIASVWGNTIPEFGMYPYMPGEKSKIFEVNDLKCRPCSKLGYKKCPKKHFYCMTKQSFVDIIKWANEI